MSTNLQLINEAFKPEQHTLEEGLVELRRFGFPRLSSHESGWYAVLEVFVTGEGVAFQVNTSFSEPTPQAAVNKCYKRLMAAMKEIKET